MPLLHSVSKMCFLRASHGCLLGIIHSFLGSHVISVRPYLTTMAKELCLPPLPSPTPTLSPFSTLLPLSSSQNLPWSEILFSFVLTAYEPSVECNVNKAMDLSLFLLPPTFRSVTSRGPKFLSNAEWGEAERRRHPNQVYNKSQKEEIRTSWVHFNEWRH